MNSEITITPKHKLDVNATSVIEDGMRLWVSGESGSGKSNASMLITEQCVRMGMQVIVLDAHGEYGELKWARPGRTVRYGYGDTPLNEDSVDTCLMYVAENQNLLLDLSHWSDLEPKKLDQFIRDFLKGVYALRRQKPHRMLIVLEEAQSVAPQQQSSGQSDNIKLVTSLITGGRKFGINFIISSQRPSLVDHNIVANCNVRLFFRLTELKDWKKVVPYLPKDFPVVFSGGGKVKKGKRDIKKFNTGEAIIVSRWFDTVSAQLPRSEYKLKKTAFKTLDVESGGED